MAFILSALFCTHFPVVIMIVDVGVCDVLCHVCFGGISVYRTVTNVFQYLVKNYQGSHLAYAA